MNTLGHSFEKSIDFSLSEHLPFKSNFLNYKGYRIHYLDVGAPSSEGPPKPVVLLLHGNPTWVFFYRGLISALCESHRVIALDYLGCGLSDRPEGKHFRAIDRVDEVDALYSHLGLGRFSIVMHDWGGAIGTKFLQRHVDKVDKIVYLNTTLTEVESLPLMIKSAANPYIGKFLTQTTSQFLRYLTGPGAVRKLPKYVRDGYLYPYKTARSRQAIWDFVRDIPFSMDHPTYRQMQDLAEGFEAMRKIPMKLVWGLRDPCFHPGMLRKISAHFQHAEICEIPDAGHLVLEDAPEKAISAVSDFLKNASDEVRSQGHVDSKIGESSLNRFYSAFISHTELNGESPACIKVHKSIGALSYSQNTFAELRELVHQYSKALSDFGLLPGERALILVEPGVEFLAFTYAVMACGAVPCFVDPGVGREKLFKCIVDCNAQALIGSPKAHILRFFQKRLFPSLKFSVGVTPFLSLGTYSLKVCKGYSSKGFAPKENPDGVAMMAFTSGATGTPKGVLFSNDNVSSQLKIFNSQFGFSQGSKDLPLLPIFSIFSLALGIGSVYPSLNPARPLDLDASHIVQVIKDLKVDSSFGSPTLWDKISAYCVRHSDELFSLRTILIAGAPVSEEVLNRVQRVAPNATVATPYGATEALPVTFVKAQDLALLRGTLSNAGEEGTPVGNPIEGVEVKIVKDAPSIVTNFQKLNFCSEGEVGEVIVRGSNVSPSYFSRLDANLQGKIKDGTTFWHRIGDVGYLKGGSLFYCGRKSHVVKTAERTYFPDPVENIFNRHSMVRRSALVSNPDGSGAAVAIEPIPESFPETDEAKRKFIDELLEIGRSSVVTNKLSSFFFFRKFPVDGRHNAKIFRDVLSEWVKEEHVSR